MGASSDAVIDPRGLREDPRGGVADEVVRVRRARLRQHRPHIVTRGPPRERFDGGEPRLEERAPADGDQRIDRAGVPELAERRGGRREELRVVRVRREAAWRTDAEMLQQRVKQFWADEQALRARVRELEAENAGLRARVEALDGTDGAPPRPPKRGLLRGFGKRGGAR